MNKIRLLLLSIAFLVIGTLSSQAQVSTVGANNIMAYSALYMRNTKIDSISNDTTFAGNRSSVLPTQHAVFGFVNKKISTALITNIYARYPAVAFNDSTIGLAQSFVDSVHWVLTTVPGPNATWNGSILNIPSSSPPGSTGFVLYNNAGALGADSRFTAFPTGISFQTKSYTGFNSNATVTANTTSDTTAQINIGQNYNDGSSGNVQHYQIHTGYFWIRFDSLFNVTFSNGGSPGNIGGNSFVALQNAAQNVTNGANLLAIGLNAARGVTNAQQATVLNNGAGWNATDIHESFLAGPGAGQSASAPHSIMIGTNTGRGSATDFSIFIGPHVGDFITFALTGINNTIIGNNITLPTAATANTMDFGNVLYVKGVNGTTGGNPISTPQTAGQLGINTVPDASAYFDVVGTAKGAYFPRMTNAQANAISAPNPGMIVYCTDCTALDASTGVLEVWNGSAFKKAW